MAKRMTMGLGPGDRSPERIYYYALAGNIVINIASMQSRFMRDLGQAWRQ